MQGIIPKACQCGKWCVKECKDNLTPTLSEGEGGIQITPSFGFNRLPVFLTSRLHLIIFLNFTSGKNDPKVYHSTDNGRVPHR